MLIELGLSEDTHLCVFIYGGQPPGQWELKEDALPDGWVCVVCSGGKPILSDKQLPSNFRLAQPDDFIPDLVRAQPEAELCFRCLASLSTDTQQPLSTRCSFMHASLVAMHSLKHSCALDASSANVIGTEL